MRIFAALWDVFCIVLLPVRSFSTGSVLSWQLYLCGVVTRAVDDLRQVADADDNRELHYYSRIIDRSVYELPADEIESNGYVVDTLEAALWCLANTNSYRECLLWAVNLGEDADTVAAVAGSLAGLYYGYDSIPHEWLAGLKNKEMIVRVCG